MDSVTARGLIAKALENINAGRFEEAGLQLGAVIDDAAAPEAEKLAALGHRGYMQRERGTYEGALKDFERVAGMIPADLTTRGFVADLKRSLGRKEEAIREALEILKSDPMNGAATQVILKAQASGGIASESRDFVPGARPLPTPPFNPLLKALEEDAQSSFPTSTLPESVRLIYSLVRAVKPKLVVETGSYIGYSGTCIAQALEDNGFGHLHCFDLFGQIGLNGDGKPAYVSPLLGKVDSFLEVARGHFRAAGLEHRITLHPGDSPAKLHEFFATSKQKADFAFIDGDHTINGCLKDWYEVVDNLAEDALVVLHDTNPDGCRWRGPRFLLQELGNKAFQDFQFINVPTYEGMGLAIIQKRTQTPSPRFQPALGELLADRLYVSKYWKKK